MGTCTPQMIDGVDRHTGRRARRRSRAGLPMVAVATIAAAGGHAAAPSAAATSRAHRALGSQDSFVGRSSRAWSPPGVLAECRLASGPWVAFPSEGPATSTGAGAIAWASNPTPCGSSSPRSGPWGVSVAAVGSTDRPTDVSTQSLGVASPITLAAVGASFGRIALTAASATHESGRGAIALLQGRTTARLGRPRLTVRSDLPPALAHGYLGDVAIAAVARGPEIDVRVERYYQHDFGPARSIPIKNGPVTALTATMDYRSDVLIAWQQNGAIYAHMLRASGRTDPTQRVGPSNPNPQIRAVVSDNDHGMIAWSSTEITEAVDRQNAGPPEPLRGRCAFHGATAAGSVRRSTAGRTQLRLARTGAPLHRERDARLDRRPNTGTT